MVALEDAKKINGLRAVFGEVYPDPVRVISVGQDVGTLVSQPAKEDWLALSIEFCGGTHLENTAQARAFVVVEETAIAKGIRRVSAVTGQAASEARAAGRAVEKAVGAAEALEGEALEQRVVALRQELEATQLSAALKPLLRRRVDELGKRAAAQRKAAGQAGIDKAVAKVRCMWGT